MNSCQELSSVTAAHIWGCLLEKERALELEGGDGCKAL